MIVIPKEIELKNDTYYFECCAGLGDTMLICGYMNALLDKYQAQVRLIVKPSHAFIPKMYGIDNSWVLGRELTEDFVRKNTRSKPRKGKIYAAHPCKHPELWDFFQPVYYYTSTIRFLTWFKQFLDISDCAQLEQPMYYPKMDSGVERQCQQLGPIDKIALVSPEATSIPALPRFFWKELAEKLHKEGLNVVSNVVSPANTISGTTRIEMSSSDVVSLGMKCHSVYSIRSGLCDLIAERGSQLHVFYPLHTTFFMYELNEMFPGANIDEQIVLHE